MKEQAFLQSAVCHCDPGIYLSQHGGPGGVVASGMMIKWAPAWTYIASKVRTVWILVLTTFSA